MVDAMAMAMAMAMAVANPSIFAKYLKVYLDLFSGAVFEKQHWQSD